MEKSFGNEAKNLLKGAKLALSMKDVSKGVVNFTVKLSTGEFIDGSLDTINQVYTIILPVFVYVIRFKKSSNIKNLSSIIRLTHSTYWTFTTLWVIIRLVSVIVDFFFILSQWFFFA